MTEAPDVMACTMEAVAVEEEGGWSEYVPAYIIPLTMRMRAVERPDVMRFTLAFDYTDEDLVMALMMAAWDEDEIYQQPPGRR